MSDDNDRSINHSMKNTNDSTQAILERFHALVDQNLSEEEIEARIKTEFTEEEQQIVTDLILGEIEMEESNHYFPDDA